MKTKPSVLFLCTGNSARSQMAEVLLRHQAGDKCEVFSAGLAPRPVNPLTVTVMEEIGLDIRGQRSKSLKEFTGKTAIDIAIFVCARAEESCPTVYPFALTALSWPFDDPSAATGTEEAKLNKFREVRDRIGDTIRAWLLKALPGPVRPHTQNVASRTSLVQLKETGT